MGTHFSQWMVGPCQCGCVPQPDRNWSGYIINRPLDPLRLPNHPDQHVSKLRNGDLLWTTRQFDIQVQFPMRGFLSFLGMAFNHVSRTVQVVYEWDDPQNNIVNETGILQLAEEDGAYVDHAAFPVQRPTGTNSSIDVGTENPAIRVNRSGQTVVLWDTVFQPRDLGVPDVFEPPLPATTTGAYFMDGVSVKSVTPIFTIGRVGGFETPEDPERVAYDTQSFRGRHLEYVDGKWIITGTTGRTVLGGSSGQIGRSAIAIEEGMTEESTLYWTQDNPIDPRLGTDGAISLPHSFDYLRPFRPFGKLIMALPLAFNADVHQIDAQTGMVERTMIIDPNEPEMTIGLDIDTPWLTDDDGHVFVIESLLSQNPFVIARAEWIGVDTPTGWMREQWNDSVPQSGNFRVLSAHFGAGKTIHGSGGGVYKAETGDWLPGIRWEDVGLGSTEITGIFARYWHSSLSGGAEGGRY